MQAASPMLNVLTITIAIGRKAREGLELPIPRIGPFSKETGGVGRDLGPAMFST